MFVINTKERFENEVENINQYVEYIEDNFYRNSCSTMRTEGFECLQELGDYVFDATENTDKENNSEIITRLGELVKNKITEYASKLTLFERKELPEISNSITEKDLDESLINYIEATVFDCMDNPEQLPYYQLIEQLTPEHLKEDVDYVESNLTEKYDNILNIEDYKSILSYVKCTLYNEYIDELEDYLQQYKELQTLYNIFNDNSKINIYRQAFILLMTSFDATLFDLFKKLLEDNFFDLAEKIKHDKKYTIKEIVNYSSFDAFKENTVDEMVAGKYAADVLEILYNYNNSLFTVDGSNVFQSVLEMVQRRNLHVHKSGIIDEKYFTKGNGRSLGLSIGDYTIIDKTYYVEATKNLTQLIINIDTLIQQ